MTLPLATTVAAQFPLVARKRPPAKPLDARVARLVRLAESAHRDRDSDTASMVSTARPWSPPTAETQSWPAPGAHRHANLYLSQAPLNGYAARFALEPVVNLARLRIRAGDGNGAHSLLTELYQAIHGRTPAIIDGLQLLPEQLATDAIQRDHIIGWLRDVMLSDGTRALTLAGRWSDALAQVRRHDGIGPTLYEGRQLAVIALTMQGHSASAAALIRETTIERPWEQAVRDLLHDWHAQTTAVGWPMSQAALLAQSLEMGSEPGLSVFRTRLCLAIMDLAADVPPTVAETAITRLVTDVLRDEDANAARDLQHRVTGPEHHGKLRRLIEASGLGIGRLPESARESLSSVLDLVETAIGVMPHGR